MNAYFQYIPILFCAFGFFFLLIRGSIIFRNKIGKIEGIVFKRRFCSIRNLRTENSSAYMSTIVVDSNYLYCYTNLISMHPLDLLGLIQKIELSTIKSVDYCTYGKSWTKHQRILLTTWNGDKFNFLCQDLQKLFDLLSEYKDFDNVPSRKNEWLKKLTNRKTTT